jgi:hypothetical protein
MKYPKMVAVLIGAGVVTLTACASGGPVKTGANTYYLTKKSAGGGFVNGDSTKAALLREANDFCGRQGKDIQLIEAESHRGIPFAKIASAEVNFRCVDK